MALAALLRKYMPALKAYLVRRERLSFHDADDMLNKFLSAKFLEANVLAGAKREKGRFRSYILTILHRFVISEWRKGRTTDHATISIEQMPLEPSDFLSTDSLNELSIEWARSLLQEVRARMRQKCMTQARDDLWEVFTARVLDPADFGSPPTPLPELVARLRYKNERQASNALVTAKRMYERCIRSVVGEYAQSEAEIDAEIADLNEIVFS